VAYAILIQISKHSHFTCQGFSAVKNSKKIIADFHILGFFLAKKHDLSEKKIRPSHAVAVRLNLCHAYSLPLKS
jgi:hypothetical protein